MAAGPSLRGGHEPEVRRRRVNVDFLRSGGDPVDAPSGKSAISKDDALGQRSECQPEKLALASGATAWTVTPDANWSGRPESNRRRPAWEAGYAALCREAL
jgi:hypothetical protein